MGADALIVTLGLDTAAHQRLTALRTRHFPPERNYLQAHVTMFHALPGDERPAIQACLGRTAEATGPLDLEAAGPMKLGRGTAIRLGGQDISAVKTLKRHLIDELTDRLGDRLTAQDRGGMRPHVTIQNKVTPTEARRLHAELAATWQPFPVTAESLRLWRYLGGPWEPIETFTFKRD